MNDPALQRLNTLIDLLDTKQTMEQFVAAFAEIVEFLKKNQDQLSSDVQSVIAQFSEMQQTMANDSKGNLDKIRGLVADAIVNLESKYDGQISAKLAELKNGNDGKDGKDGVSIPGERGTDGKDGSPDTPDQVVEKVNTSSILIKKERVEGLTDLIRNIAASVSGAVGITTTFFFKNGTQIGRAKNINIVEGNNITATLYQTGDQMNISISSTGGSGGATWVDSEVPSGSGTTFTLAHTPVAGTVKVYRGGARQQVGVDYTLSGSTITLTNALITGEVLVVDYGY